MLRLTAMLAGMKKRAKDAVERMQQQEGAEEAPSAAATAAVDSPSEPTVDGGLAPKTGWEAMSEEHAAKVEREAQELEAHQGEIAANESKASKSQQAADGEAAAHEKATNGTAAMSRLRGGASGLQERLREKQEQRHTAGAGMSKSR